MNTQNLMQKVMRSLCLNPASLPVLAEQINQAIRADEQIENEVRYLRKVNEKEAGRQRSAGVVTRLCDLDLARFATTIEAKIAAFLDEFEAWTERVPLPGMLPHPIARDIALVATFRLGVIAAFVLETVVGTFVVVGLDPRYGLVQSALATVVFAACAMILTDAGLLALTDRPSPRETRVLLLQVLKPSFAVVAVCLVGIGLVRLISNQQTYKLLMPVVQLALVVISLGLIPLGGALLATADFYGWSLRDSVAYEQLEEARIRTEGIKQKYLARLPQTASGDYTIVELRPSFTKAARRPTISLSPLLAVVIFGSAMMTGCTPESGLNSPADAPAVGRPVKQPLTAAERMELHILLDRTPSLRADAAAAAARNVREQLPELIAVMRATRLTIEGFAADGLSPTELASLDLPRNQAVRRENLPECVNTGGELTALPHTERIKAETCRRALAEAEARTTQTYLAALQQALAQITPETLNPPAATTTPCTDFYGVLYRIATLQRTGLHRFIVVTDGRNTCGPLKPLRQPAGDVKALVLLAPANVSESKRQRSVDQFESAKETLLKAAPWLEITWASERGLASYFGAKASPEATPTAQL